MITIKRIDVGSAMRVAALLYALNFTVFGVLILGLQSAFINSISSATNNMTVNGQQVDFGAFAFTNLLCCGAFYLFGVVASAIAGGIFGAVTAFLYNLIANWVGGLRVELETSEGAEKAKRDAGFGSTVIE
ncbi:MAG: DUF3566 domain-containing protein [Anaerolineae bacterium]|nr:DUF3566 domain-containing protein [Anaerolineae bacterium]